MRVAPFIGEGINQQNAVAMDANFHLLAHMHVLYFGPIECARHSFSGLAEDEDASVLVVNDLQTSLGETESHVEEAVREISAGDATIEGFVLCTACQTAFLGIDFDALCRRLNESTGLYFMHVEFNRMYAGNIPGKTRKDISGGDRLHVRRELIKMLAQHAGAASDGKGILVLSDDPLDEENDLHDYLELEGISWVRSVGGMDGAKMLLACRDAALALVMTPTWREAGEYLEDTLGIPVKYVPMSYSEGEIAEQYQRIDQLLEEHGSAAAWEEVHNTREKRRQHVHARLEAAVRKAPALDLDLRVVNRPFSLVEALMDYGFTVRDFTPGTQQVNHKEPDDLPAYQRLSEKRPDIGARFRVQPKSPGKKGGSMVGQGRRGRYIYTSKPKHIERVPEETCWWGYSSLEALLGYIEEDIRKAQAGGGAL